MVIIIKHTKEAIYFVKYLSINKIECIVVNFYENNKIKLFDLFDKVKIKIKKIIDKSSDEGKYILYNLGYIDSYDKIILKCTVKIKLNKKINNILFIIINHCVSMTLDKYIIHDNNYTYDSSLMEDKENLFC
jgi:hypothetical protein